MIYIVLCFNVREKNYMEFNNTAINVDTKKLVRMALIRFGGAILIISLILFLPAGTIKYWNGWLFIGALFIPVILVLIYLIKNDPELLEKRMKTKEKEETQKLIIKLSFIPFIISFLTPGFDYRYQWSAVPLWLVIIATVIMLIGYGMFFIVIRQNSYASRVVEVQEKQKLIDTGLYSVVRHPMYLANVIIYLSIPLVLGSYYSLLVISLFLVVFYFRIKNEEEVLKEGLEGYSDYMKKVKYRLIPYVW
jgi:protein-S-isoprenylcysteine O-methyltransferase Ste14